MRGESRGDGLVALLAVAFCAPRGPDGPWIRPTVTIVYISKEGSPPGLRHGWNCDAPIGETVAYFARPTLWSPSTWPATASPARAEVLAIRPSEPT